MGSFGSFILSSMTFQDMFSRFRFYLLLVLPFVANYVVSAPNCNDSDLKACMEELKVFTSNQDLAFAQTEHELSQTCGHLQDAMQCVNDFTSRCFDNVQRDLYRQLTRGAQSLLTDLCTENSQFRREYLVHASCYRNLSADYRVCADNYLIQQESAKRESLTAQDRLRKSCCLFDGYKECTRVAVEKKCSKEAARLGEDIVTKAGGPLVQTHCANYKHNSINCAFSSAGHLISSVSSILILAVILPLTLPRYFREYRTAGKEISVLV